jgi:nucleotide-binding universal stress UspA family protein
VTGFTPRSATVLDLDPVSFDRILVPVDGSPLSTSALGPAAELAHRFGAELELLAFGADVVEARALGGMVESLAAPLGATARGRVHRDAATGIVEALAGEGRTLLCMASHGRGGLRAALVGSVATSVLAAAADPVLLVGPGYDPSRALFDGPVLACVDGSPVSEAVVAPAASWAVALGVPLGVATVAEFIPEPAVGQPDRRLHGPHSDAWDYVSGIAAAWRLHGIQVDPVVIYDEVGPAAGLWSHLHENAGGIVAVRTRGLTGWARTLLGSKAVAIVRTSPVPVLVVPPRH